MTARLKDAFRRHDLVRTVSRCEEIKAASKEAAKNWAYI